MSKMKKMKNAFLIFLAAVLVLSSGAVFSACSKNSGKYELVLITDGAPIDDNAYNQSAWEGVKSYGEEKKLKYGYYQPELNDDQSLDIETIADYVQRAVDGGAKYIVFPGESFEVAAYEIAPTYHDVQFILVDGLPHSASDTSLRLQSNVMCVYFNTLQAGFAAGCASVMQGKTKLGYLGSYRTDVSTAYGAGYAQGAAYAADESKTPVTLDYVEIDVENKDDDTVTDTAVSVAKQMVTDGAEVIFSGEDRIGDALFTAAESAPSAVSVFAAVLDKSSNEDCMAAVVNDYGKAVQCCLEDFQGGIIFNADCSNGCVYVTGSNTEEYEKIYAKLSDGEIPLIPVQTGADFRNTVDSSYLTINYRVN